MTGITILDQQGELVTNSWLFDTDTLVFSDKKGNELGKALAWAICCPDEVHAGKARLCMPHEMYHKAIVTDPAPTPPSNVDAESDEYRAWKKQLSQWLLVIKLTIKAVSR